MRILHVTDTYLPRLGGIELHVSDLAARQNGAGHEVLVLTAERPARAPAAVPAGARGVPVVRLRTRSARRLRAVLDRFAPDIVHAHLTVGSPFTWGVLRAVVPRPTVVSVHSLLPDAPRLVRAGIRLVGIPASQICFTAVSQAAADRVRAALPAGQPVHVLHNGIDPESWVVPHRPAATFRILVVGRLAARKRPLVLVEALAGLARSAPRLRWRATLVGDGAQRGKVVAAVRAHGLGDRVRLAGALGRDQIRDLLGGTDVLVAPARLESFGIAALEARCAGVPVIGMAGSGVGEFVTHGQEGLLAVNDADIARALHRLATEPGLARSIRRFDAATPVAMQWRTVLRRHEEVYAAAGSDAAQFSPMGRSAFSG